MAITTTQVVALTDNISKAISDVNANFVAGTSSATTTINAGVAGTGGSATVGRILAYSDLPSELALLAQANSVASLVAADLSGRRSLTNFYVDFYPLLNALDSLVGGLNAYLTTNTLVVNAYFAAAFNAFAASAVNLQFRTTANAPVALATANYFPYTVIDTMWNMTVSGATTFSVNTVGSNASTAVSGGGVGQFYIYRSGSAGTATTPAGQVFTVTYTNAAGNAANATYTTTSAVPPASGNLAAGYAISGAIGSAITGVTGTGMDTSSQWVIGMQLVRTAAY